MPSDYFNIVNKLLVGDVPCISDPITVRVDAGYRGHGVPSVASLCDKMLYSWCIPLWQACGVRDSVQTDCCPDQSAPSTRQYQQSEKSMRFIILHPIYFLVNVTENGKIFDAVLLIFLLPPLAFRGLTKVYSFYPQVVQSSEKCSKKCPTYVNLSWAGYML